MKNKKVLIFGGTGFVGSHLAMTCHARGSTVVAVNRRMIARGMVPYETVVGDVVDKERVLAIIDSVRPDYIFNCVGLLTRGTAEITEADAQNVNEFGSNNIVDAIATYYDRGGKISGAVFLGTMMEYGLTPPVLREDALAIPVGAYGETKHRATEYMVAKAKQYGLPLVSARLFTPYGSGMSPDSLVARICSQAIAGSPLTLSSPTVTRDFIAIEDVVDALLTLAEYAPQAQGEIFNIGSGQATTLEEFVALVLELSASASVVTWDEGRVSLNDQRRWEAIIDKITTNTDWYPKISLRSGLTSLLAGKQ